MAQSITSNGDQKEDKTLLQHSQLSQHGEFRYISVCERQWSRPCGQIFVCLSQERYCHRKLKGALKQWWPTVRQKRSYLHHQGEFQHHLLSFRSVLDSDHCGVVRISVGQAQVLKHYLCSSPRPGPMFWNILCGVPGSVNWSIIYDWRRSRVTTVIKCNSLHVMCRFDSRPSYSLLSSVV